jgi:hypothetical protein
MFLRGIINALPVWEIFLIVFIAFMLITLLAVYLGNVLIPQEKVDESYSRTTDSVLNILGSGYGVFLGFVIITLWNHYLNVQKIVYEEADSISVMVRNLAVFPPEKAAPLKAGISQYLEAVRNDEWELMRLGEESPKAWAAVQNLFVVLQNFTASTRKEDLFYRTILSEMVSVLKERRNRLLAARTIINAELRAALILGAVIIIFLSSLLKAREGTMRIFANVCLAAVIAFNLTLALSFDFPFSGSVSVSNSPYYQGALADL